GTYPLPEAQLDRFMFNLKIDYPSFAEEVDIVKSTTGLKSAQLRHVVSRKELSDFQNLVKNVPAADNVIEYAVKIVSCTRPKNESAPKFVKDWLDWGAGPRASSYLILGAKALAVIDGRTTPDMADVKRLVKPVLRHRVITNFNAEADNIKTDDILEKLMDHMSAK
ncbi:MAG: AAA family ATPase, partial [Fidelibacterota bacterium]